MSAAGCSSVILATDGLGKYTERNVLLLLTYLIIVSFRLCRPCVTSDPYADGLTFARNAFKGGGGGTRYQKAGRTIYNYI